MSKAQAISGEPQVRASDAERDQGAEILRSGYAEGRLTRAELDDRLGAVYAAKTFADLRDLTSDLPAPKTAGSPAAQDLLLMNPGPQPGTGIYLDWCLLLCLLIVFPPAGIAYWILAARRQPRSVTEEPQPVLPSAGAT
jgi:hypothetical protein